MKPLNDTKENSIKISAQNYINSVNINRFKNSEVISGSYTVSELKSLGVDGEGYPSDGILFLGPKSISGCIDIDNKKIFYYQ